ncbi:Sugar phosphate transporter domain [Sesbania bispinosa]|nr:Sugar phosphate transporter domain [Sesbania bispinosa]
MIFSLRQPGIGITGSGVVLRNRHATPVQPRSFLPSLSREKVQKPLVSVQKPLHLASLGVGNFGSVRTFESEKNPRRDDLVKCGAYEADRSEIEAAATPTEAVNKVAVAHTIGHVAATVSMSKVAVSFTHIIKSGEPAFSVLVSRFLLGETFPVPVYLSLIPIIGGCALAAVTELNFNMTGFMGAMISNLAFVFRNIFSKKGMKGKSVSGMNYYACLSILSLALLTPFAIAVEGPQMWAAGWQTAISQIGPQFIWWVAAQSIFYHLYNQVSYMSLDEISPLTFSIGNTMKRISVIVSSIIIFHTPVQPVNALGAAIAVLGTFLYSQRENAFRVFEDAYYRTMRRTWNLRVCRVWCQCASRILAILFDGAILKLGKTIELENQNSSRGLFRLSSLTMDKEVDFGVCDCWIFVKTRNDPAVNPSVDNK